MHSCGRGGSSLCSTHTHHEGEGAGGWGEAVKGGRTENTALADAASRSPFSIRQLQTQHARHSLRPTRRGSGVRGAEATRSLCPPKRPPTSDPKTKHVGVFCHGFRGDSPRTLSSGPALTSSPTACTPVRHCGPCAPNKPDPRGGRVGGSAGGCQAPKSPRPWAL